MRSITRGRLARLTKLGGLEVALSLCLAGFAVVAHLGVPGPWQALAIDLLACLAAALCGRWPRVGGAALGAVLLVFVLVPAPWATLGEYAAMIPVLGSGIRGHKRLRLILTAVYFPLVAGITWLDAPRPASALLGWVFWIVAFTVMWAIGSSVAHALEIQKQARLADLMRQRQDVARELHDTVAASLTKLAMVAERAQLRGSASPADLELMADSAAASVQELRWIVNLLREPADLEHLSLIRETSLSSAIAEAETQLVRHGYRSNVNVRGEFGKLGELTTAGLSAVVVEATNNIIKHGDPSKPAFILVDISDRSAELVFINDARPEQSSTTTIDAYGLKGIRERVSSLGGTVSAGQQQGRWIARIEAPLNTERPVPGRVA